MTEMKRILWMDDQYEDLIDYAGRLFRTGYLIEPVKSVSAALEKLVKDRYDAYIFDLKVLPGDDPVWQELDEKIRKGKPFFDPYLGIEFLRFLYEEKKMNSELWRRIEFDFNKVIIFSAACEGNVREELESFGISKHQMLNRFISDLDNLPQLLKKINRT